VLRTGRAEDVQDTVGALVHEAETWLTGLWKPLSPERNEHGTKGTTRFTHMPNQMNFQQIRQAIHSGCCPFATPDNLNKLDTRHRIYPTGKIAAQCWNWPIQSKGDKNGRKLYS